MHNKMQEYVDAIVLAGRLDSKIMSPGQAYKIVAWAHCGGGLAVLTTEFNVKLYNAARMINKAIELRSVVKAEILLELFTKAKIDQLPNVLNSGRILGRLGIGKENTAAYLQTLTWLSVKAVDELFKNNANRIAVDCLHCELNKISS